MVESEELNKPLTLKELLSLEPFGKDVVWFSYIGDSWGERLSRYEIPYGLSINNNFYTFESRRAEPIDNYGKKWVVYKHKTEKGGVE